MSSGLENDKNVVDNSLLDDEDRYLNDKISLWQSPYITMKYALCEIFLRINSYIIWGFQHKTKVIPVVLFIISLYMSAYVNGYHQKYAIILKEFTLWFGYWIVLGFLSSVGLGAGLHTFVLYLGPFIAMVTLGGWECLTVNFPKPPYPNEILCPEDMKNTIDSKISFWIILTKIKWEAFFWGFGTAIGELPPFFMARAAVLSKNELYKKDESFEQYERLTTSNLKKMSIYDRIKAYILYNISRTGFWGILLFASIPNPLFDLAGIACGHCLVPLSTFFTATVIGKSIIKTFLQTSFVIISFSPKYTTEILERLGSVPFIGVFIQSAFSSIVEFQKLKFHKYRNGTLTNEMSAGKDWFSFLFEIFIILMILYFIFSIIDTMAQVYYRRYQTAVKIVTKKKIN